MKRLLQLLLALTLAGPSAGGSLSKKHGTFNYVAFGDSQTAGLGLHGFVPEEFYEDPSLYYKAEEGDFWNMTGAMKDGYYGCGYVFQSEKSYPHLIKAELEKTYSTVNLYDRAMNGMRTRELEAILNEEAFEGYADMVGVSMYFSDVERARHDEITTGGVTYIHEKEETNIREEIIQSVIDADLITYDLGANDFGGYFMMGQMMPMLDMYAAMIEAQIEAGGETNWRTGEFTPYSEAELIELNGFLLMIQEMINSGDPAILLAKEYGEEYGNFYTQAKGYILHLIEDYLGGLIPTELTSMIEGYADMFAFALIGYISAFDSTMKRIFELNPDVEIVVMGLQNIYDGMDMNIGGDVVIPFGDLVGVLMQIANTYVKLFSPYADQVYYADLYPHVDDYLTQFRAWDGGLESLLEMSDFIDTLNVYSTDQVEYTIKTEIAENRNYTDALHEEPLSYDEIMSLDYGYIGNISLDLGLRNEMKKELSVKSKVGYYTYAKAFQYACSNSVLSLDMSSVWGGDGFDGLDEIRKIAKETEAKYDKRFSESRNLDNLLTIVDAAVADIFAGEENRANAEALFGQLTMGTFANAVMIHRNANGHVQCAEAALNAFYSKRTAKNIGYTSLSELIPEFSLSEAIEMIEKIGGTVYGLATGDEETIAEIKEFIGGVSEFIQELTPVFGIVAGLAADFIHYFEIDTAIIELLNQEPYKTIIAETKALIADVAEAIDTALVVQEFIDLINSTFIGRAINGVGSVIGGAVAETVYTTVEAVVEFVTPYVEAVKEGVTALVTTVAEISRRLSELAIELTINMVSFTVESIVGAIQDKVEAFVGAVKAEIETEINAVIDYVTEIYNFVTTTIDTITSVIDFFASGRFEALVKDTLEACVDFVVSAYEGAVQYVEDTIEAVKNTVNEAIEFVKTAYDTVVAAAECFVETIENTIDFAIELYHAVKDGIVNTVELAVAVYTYIENKIPEIVEDINDFIDSLEVAFADAVADAKAFIGEVIDKAEEGLEYLEAEIIKVGHVIDKHIMITLHILDEITERVIFVADVLYEIYDAIPDEIIDAAKEAIEAVHLRFVKDVLLLAEQFEGFLSELGTDVVAEAKLLGAKLVEMNSLLMEIVNGSIEQMVTALVTSIAEAYDYTVEEIETFVKKVIDTVNDDTVAFVDAVKELVATIDEELHTPIVIEVDQDIEHIEDEIEDLNGAIEDFVESAEEDLGDADDAITSAWEALLYQWNLRP